MCVELSVATSFSFLEAASLPEDLAAKQIFDFGIGEVERAGMLGMDQGKLNRIVVRTLPFRDFGLNGGANEIFDADPAQSGGGFHLAKQRIGQINGGAHGHSLA